MSAVELSLALSPQGTLHLEAPAAPPDAPAPEIARHIAEAFSLGDGSGLFLLGAAEPDATLSPGLAFWRDVGRLFVTELCAIPDLENLRTGAKVEPPRQELAALCAAAPPMIGGEYLTAAVLEALWSRVEAAFQEELTRWDGTVEAFLRQKSPLWNVVGRVCFHLAENKGDEDAPFAFVATYTTRLGAQAKAQHVPLGQALREYAGARNKPALLALLTPVQRAALTSAVAKDLVESGGVFEALAWTPAEAHRFLKDVPIFESSGVVVRVPASWHAKRPPRPEVQITIGARQASTLGADAMLDFSAALTLEGEPLTAREVREILATTEGLALVRGRWVEIDRDKLSQVLDHWKAFESSQATGGVSLIDGLRLLAGARIDKGDAGPTLAETAEWSKVVAGDGLGRTLAGLRSPEGLRAVEPGAALRADLRPYQKVGLRWLWWLQSLGLGGCLADDMGLGKTIQVIALLTMLKAKGERTPSLLVVPASLIANWRAELARFSPGLNVLIAHPSEMPSPELVALEASRIDDRDIVITSYGAVHRVPWLATRQWNLVVLDEAQAIKNPGAKQTRAVKALRGRVRIALTGTPVENRLGDLWSLFDFICPGLLGSPKAFSRFTKAAEARAQGFRPLRALVGPYILRRLKTDRSVIADLPDKTEVRAFCGLTKKQAVLYQQAVDELAAALKSADGIKRRGVVLASLMRFKQICNHPSQWLADGAYVAADSGKFARLAEIAEEVAERQEKVLVFTQFRELTVPLARFLTGVFGSPGLVLSGETDVRKRQGLVDQFQRDDGPPFFVLSLKAGGTGLNLTAATHVVHFDRWWNPAVESQATDRAYRIGQKRNVLVHKFVCRGTVEEKIDALIESKQTLSREILEGGGETLLTEMSDADLMRIVAIDIKTALAEV